MMKEGSHQHRPLISQRVGVELGVGGKINDGSKCGGKCDLKMNFVQRMNIEMEQKRMIMR